uniref:ATPase subunit 8 n=1 Tax=Albinaria caerulea TaxID=42349 RepID=A6XDL5_ALBCA|nr:ATPase subunit 8 [Albinaria caerulea]
MPQLSPMNGLLIMFSVTLMLLTVLLVINHFMLKPMASPPLTSHMKAKKSGGEKLYY